MNVPTVLFYGLDSPKGQKIKLLCLAMKFRVRVVREEEYFETLGALLGQEEKQGVAGQAFGFTEEMLVMANLSGSQMDRFLLGFRKKKIPPVSLKAVLTATNVEWNSVELYQELKSEHEAMSTGGAAHKAQAL